MTTAITRSNGIPCSLRANTDTLRIAPTRLAIMAPEDRTGLCAASPGKKRGCA